MNKIKNGLVALSLATLPLVGCSQPSEPKFEDYANSSKIVYLKSVGEVTLNDHDNDGKVDTIRTRHSPMLTLYLSKECENANRFDQPGITKPMTPEIRGVASKILKNFQELNYLIAQDKYKENGEK